MRQGGSLGAQHGIVAMHGARLDGNGRRRRFRQASSSGSNGGGDRDRRARDHGRDMADRGGSENKPRVIAQCAQRSNVKLQ